MHQYLRGSLKAECDSIVINGAQMKLLKAKLDDHKREKKHGVLLRVRDGKVISCEQPTVADKRSFALFREISALRYDGHLNQDKHVIELAFIESYDKLLGQRKNSERYDGHQELV